MAVFGRTGSDPAEAFDLKKREAAQGLAINKFQNLETYLYLCGNI